MVRKRDEDRIEEEGGWGLQRNEREKWEGEGERGDGGRETNGVRDED